MTSCALDVRIEKQLYYSDVSTEEVRTASILQEIENDGKALSFSVEHSSRNKLALFGKLAMHPNPMRGYRVLMKIEGK